MYLLTNIALAAIPSVLIVLYIYRKDSGAKEPPKLVFAAFILGFFAVIPAIVIELAISEMATQLTGIAYILFRAFVIAALVEEGTKLTVVRLFLYNRAAFDEVADGMLYTITASLGFAFFENILYSFGPPSTLIIRGLSAVPLHAAASGILGYYIGVSKITGQNKWFTGLFWAVAIHGLYDFLLFTGSLLAFLVIPLLIIALVALKRLFKKARGYNVERGPEPFAT